jgi:hypothetical protein
MSSLVVSPSAWIVNGVLNMLPVIASMRLDLQFNESLRHFIGMIGQRHATSACGAILAKRFGSDMIKPSGSSATFRNGSSVDGA